MVCQLRPRRWRMACLTTHTCVCQLRPLLDRLVLSPTSYQAKKPEKKPKKGFYKTLGEQSDLSLTLTVTLKFTSQSRSLHISFFFFLFCFPFSSVTLKKKTVLRLSIRFHLMQMTLFNLFPNQLHHLPHQIPVLFPISQRGKAVGKSM